VRDLISTPLVELTTQHDLLYGVVKTLDLSEPSNGSLVRKGRGVQHVKKGTYWLLQQSLGCVSSYVKYVYLSFDKWEIVSSTKSWSSTWSLALYGTGRRLCKRAARAFSTNSGRNQCTKFRKVFNLKLFGGGVSKNFGMPNGSNPYGIRAPAVSRKFSSKGGQLKSSYKEIRAVKSGSDILKDIVTGELNSVENVYQKIICDVEILKAGYKKLRSNPGSRTPGVDNKNLNDLRINEQYFANLAHKLKTEIYKPKPTKRVLIPKTNAKTRSLGILSVEDRIVQQALLFLLEAVFEKTFSGTSHGFRPNRGAHTACKNIRLWKSVSWFVEGNIVSYFDKINHATLMEIINSKIKDQQVIDLLWKFLRAGVIVNEKYQATNLGVLQGAIISPILSNIYLDKLDQYMVVLGKELNTEKTSESNPEYVKAKSRLRSRKGKEKKKGYQDLRTIKLTTRIGLKLYYIRYVDDWLIGVWGSKDDALKIRNRIEIFLKDKLALEMSAKKTKITHAGKEKAEFLGYEIYSPTPKESFFAKGKVKKRASHLSIYIDAPYKNLKKRLIEENILVEKNDKWLINGITHWINYNHAEILYRYNWIIRGYLNYYSHVNNLHIFHKFIVFILRHSCAITLGRKLKLRSRKKVFKKFGLNLRDPGTQIELAIPTDFKKNIDASKITINSDPLRIIKWSVRTQNLMQGPCVGCGATDNLEVHHVKRLSKKADAKSSLGQIMSKLGRKQVVACQKCHDDIHSGAYDKNKSHEKTK
jgi:group II intron reverse transcriptase/maturase